MSATKPMTMTEKIIARHAGMPSVQAGDLVDVSVDLVMANDVTAPIAIREFKKTGLAHTFDPSKVVMVPSHFAPAKDLFAARNCEIMRTFAKEEGCVYFEIGRGGIEHVVLPERGYCRPGDLIIGADSHTCTYGALNCFSSGMGSTDIAAAMATGSTWLKVPETIKVVYNGRLPEYVGGKDLVLRTIGEIGDDGARYMAIEFTGSAIHDLPMEGRLTITNMTIEAGGKNGILPFDEITREYLVGRTDVPYEPVVADEGAIYARTIEFDVSNMEPQIAAPYSPANVFPLSQMAGTKINQVVIGSCTNGRISDLRLAAKVLGENRIDEGVRCIVIPGSQDVYIQAMREGLAEKFASAGAVFSTATCGPCLGGYMGVADEQDVIVSTTNRNFRGRMGHVEAHVYLANPAVAIASAITGRITDPREVMDLVPA
jgi:3-isopropylmalate/(R)-2-methylmalate dehydratase large subunit